MEGDDEEGEEEDADTDSEEEAAGPEGSAGGAGKEGPGGSATAGAKAEAAVDASWLEDDSIDAMVPVASGSSVFAIVSCMNHRWVRGGEGGGGGSDGLRPLHQPCTLPLCCRLRDRCGLTLPFHHRRQGRLPCRAPRRTPPPHPPHTHCRSHPESHASPAECATGAGSPCVSTTPSFTHFRDQSCRAPHPLQHRQLPHRQVTPAQPTSPACAATAGGTGPATTAPAGPMAAALGPAPESDLRALGLLLHFARSHGQPFGCCRCPSVLQHIFRRPRCGCVYVHSDGGGVTPSAAHSLLAPVECEHARGDPQGRHTAVAWTLRPRRHMPPARS
jgi:hypothetical protein